jgi:fermentation-respiration switch protein FrsA (DUF1100 family)
MKTARIAVFVVSMFFGVILMAGIFLAEAALHPGRRPLLPADLILARKIAAQNDSDLAEVNIPAADGVPLRAWNLHPRISNGNAVIVFHGLSDNRAGMTGYAYIFLKHGYHLLMPDARAHGASGGETATYGLRESDDIRRWLDWLGETQHPACIYGFAESMGAAGLLQSLQSESQFCAVVAESPFSNFREIAYDRIGQFFHTGSWLGRTVLRPVVGFAFAYARWKYKMDFEQISPERIVAATRTPILLIHGQVDKNIPLRHSRRIAARNHTVVLWEVPGADHCGAIGTAPEVLEKRVIDWFENNKDRPATNRTMRYGLRL